MNLLLLSASRVGDTAYLEHALPFINNYLNGAGSSRKKILFIPYAGITMSYSEYTDKVSDACKTLNVEITGIHEYEDLKSAVDQTDVIMVGGGNTFALLDKLQKDGLIPIIVNKLKKSGYYIGWSAGSNIAGQTIKTTNDMPIVEPESFMSLGLLPFQINPHYTDYKPPGFNGETREMRLQEFMVLNPDTIVVGIQEGTALQLQAGKLKLVGKLPGYKFLNGSKTEILPNSDLTELI